MYDFPASYEVEKSYMQIQDSVGARVDEVWWSGPLRSPVGGDGIVFHQDVGQGNRSPLSLDGLL